MVETRVQDAVFCWKSGFVVALRCSSEFWLAHADAITAQTPLEEVALATPPFIPNVSTYGPGRRTMVVGTVAFQWRGRGVIHDCGPSKDLAEVAAEMFRAEWPHIIFHLPEVGVGLNDGGSPSWSPISRLEFRDSPLRDTGTIRSSVQYRWQRNGNR